MAGNPQIEVFGLNEMLRDLRKMPKEVNNELRKENQELVREIITDAQGRPVTAQQSLVANVLRAKRDRIPGILVPSRRFPGNKKAHLHDVFYGAEFGGRARRTTQQFQPHRGRSGYFLWPAIRENYKDVADRYMKRIRQIWSRR